MPSQTPSPPSAPPPAREAALDGVRAVAIAMVVAIHTFGYVDLPDGSLEALLSGIVRPVAVPTFFLVDGFLFARAQRTGRPFDARRHRRRSARRLLLPWLVFGLLYCVLRWAWELATPTDLRLLAGHGPRAWLEALLLSRASEQLYFLPALFAIRLLGAPLARLARRGPASRWLAFGAAALACGPLAGAWRSWLPLPGYDPIVYALWGLPFFLLGFAALDLWRRGPWPAVAALAGPALARLAWPEVSAANQYAYLLALFLLFASFDLTPAWLAAIGRRTLPIYLLHAPIVLRAASLVAERALPGHAGLRFALVWAAGFALSLAGALALERTRIGRLVLGEPPAAPGGPR